MGIKGRLLLLSLLLVMGVGITGYDLLYRFPDRANPKSGEKLKIEVPKGVGPKKLASILFDSGLIESPGRFSLWVRLQNKLTSVKAGEFELADNLTPKEIIAFLSGRTTHKGIKILIPEGFTLTQIADTLDKAGIATKSAFLSSATDETFVDRHNINGATFEGYLFPDTYYFEKETPPETVIQTMTGNFFKKLDRLGIKRDNHLQRIVTLASIVQSETRHQDEMPIVAGVYANRLDTEKHPSGRLQADPTVAYGCEPFIRPRASSCNTFEGVLGRKQLDDLENPYNTYRHPGLPPGPISAPGIAALKAAAHPKEVPYLYFVASDKMNGRHVFSATLEAHNRAVDAWRKANTSTSEN